MISNKRNSHIIRKRSVVLFHSIHDTIRAINDIHTRKLMAFIIKSTVCGVEVSMVDVPNRVSL